MQKTGSQQDKEDEEDSIAAEDYNESVAYAEFMSTNCCEKIPQDNVTVLAISEASEIWNSADIQKEHLHGHAVKIKAHSKHLFAIAFSEQKPAGRLRINDRSAIYRLIPPKPCLL